MQLRNGYPTGMKVALQALYTHKGVPGVQTVLCYY